MSGHVPERIDQPAAPPRPAGVAAGLVRVIRWWALAGGVIVGGLAVMSAYSALGNLLFRSPFAPDYELSKHLMAVAVFMFLPYCQIAGANVNVDIFTERLDPRAKAVMSVVAAVLAASFALLLLRQMTLGFDGYLRYPEVTPVLGLPLWTAFPPILISLGLLLAAALMTLADAFGGLRGKSGRFSLEETDADA